MPVTPTPSDIDLIVTRALTGESKQARDDAIKEFKLQARQSVVPAEAIKGLVERLLGSAEESDESESNESESEADSNEDSELSGEDDDLPALSIPNVPKDLLAGHNEDVILDDINLSSYSLLEILADGIDLEDPKAAAREAAKKESAKQERELEVSSLRILTVIDSWLSGVPLLPLDPVVTAIPLELVRLMFHSSAPSVVVSKASAVLDSAWRSNFSIEKHASLATTAVVAELCQLAGRARRALPEHLEVVGRAVNKLAVSNSLAAEVIEEQLISWVTESSFKKSSGSHFFKHFNRLNIDWVRIATACTRSFRFRELLNLLPDKQLTIDQIEEVAVCALKAGLPAEGAKLLMKRWVQGRVLDLEFSDWIENGKKDEKLRKNLAAVVNKRKRLDS